MRRPNKNVDFTVKNAGSTAKNSGFTIIELLVVIFIMVTLTSVVLTNFSATNKAHSVIIAKNNLISDLRAMQSASLVSKDIAPGRPSSDYGIVFSASGTSYSLVGDDNAVPANRTTFSTVNLPANVRISGYSITRPDNSTTSATSLTVIFSVPYGRTLQTFSGGAISGNSEANDITTITIGVVDGSVASTTLAINGITGNISP